MMMPVSVAMPKQAMKPTQTATLKSIGGASQPLHDLGEQEQEEGAAGQRLGHRQHHQARVGQVLVGQVQDHEDQHDHRPGR